MKKYFVFLNNQQLGPMTLQQVKLLGIQLNTLVRTEGMANWTPAGQIEELRQALIDNSGTGRGGSKPPTTRKRSSDIVMPDHSDTRGAQQDRQKRVRFFMVTLIAVAVGAGFYMNRQQHTTNTTTVPVEPENIITEKDTLVREEPVNKKRYSAEAEEITNPGNFLHIVSSFHENTTTKSIITGFITNNAKNTTYKNVGFTVFYLDKNRVSLDIESFKVPDNVPPGETIRFLFRVKAPKNTFSTDVTYDEAMVSKD